MKTSIVAFCMILLLIVAITPFPAYMYYQFLRIALALGFVWMCFDAVSKDSSKWLMTWIFWGALYSPDADFSFSKKIWVVINIMTIFTLALHLFKTHIDKKIKN